MLVTIPPHGEAMSSLVKSLVEKVDDESSNLVKENPLWEENTSSSPLDEKVAFGKRVAEHIILHS